MENRRWRLDGLWAVALMECAPCHPHCDRVSKGDALGFAMRVHDKVRLLVFVDAQFDLDVCSAERSIRIFVGDAYETSLCGTRGASNGPLSS